MSNILQFIGIEYLMDIIYKKANLNIWQLNTEWSISELFIFMGIVYAVKSPTEVQSFCRYAGKEFLRALPAVFSDVHLNTAALNSRFETEWIMWNRTNISFDSRNQVVWF